MRWRIRVLAAWLGLVEPSLTEAQFRADPVIRLAAQVMDPMRCALVPPRLSSAELRALAEAAQAEQRES